MRLPEYSLQLWEQSVGNKTEIPTWKEFDTFLMDRFRALESTLHVKGSSHQTFLSLGEKHNLTSNRVKAHHMQIESLKCKVCEDDHEIFKCKKFSNLEYKNKILILKKIDIVSIA